VGQRSKVMGLEPEVREAFEAKLIGSHFSGYVELQDWLRSLGYDISKSALHRYGSRLEEQIANLRIATNEAKALVEASPDSESSMARGLMRLYQEKLWVALREMQLDPEEVDINKIGKLLAPLVRADVHLNKFAAEVREKTAKVVDELVAAQGMDDKQADFWKRKFLGVAQA
jgi:Protein of unknown function (DUF3486)